MTLRVGWIADEPGYIGGAELTAQEFAAAAPDGIEVVELPQTDHLLAYPPLRWQTCDVFVVHNCVHLPAAAIEMLKTKPVVKYVHDAWPHGDREVRNWLLANAQLMFTSPLHVEMFEWLLPQGPPVLCAPPMNLELFREACESATSVKAAALMLANNGKGLAEAYAWAVGAGVKLDVYGHGTAAGPVDPVDVPALMASYEHFVHIPTEPEPFGRTVVEAFAAGCRVQVNVNVGALWWVQEHPEFLEPGVAAEFFWNGVILAAKAGA